MQARVSLLALALLAGAAPAWASSRPVGHAPSAIIDVANARNPYGNIDRKDDAGNDTGDSQVDRLNTMQLDQNYRGGAMDPARQAPPAPPPSPYPAPMAPMRPGY